MEKFTAWLREYPLYALLLVAVIIAAAFVFKLAGKSYRRYYERYRKEEAEIKRLVSLKERFSSLSEEVIEKEEEKELLEGVALSYQLKLQKCSDMDGEFLKLNKEKQYAYALDIFVHENSVRDFFKENGEVLKDIIVPAFEMIGLKNEGEMLLPLKRMFDEKDLEASVDQRKINEVQQYFDENTVLTQVKENSAKYIKENPKLFVML